MTREVLVAVRSLLPPEAAAWVPPDLEAYLAGGEPPATDVVRDEATKLSRQASNFACNACWAASGKRAPCDLADSASFAAYSVVAAMTLVAMPADADREGRERVVKSREMYYDDDAEGEDEAAVSAWNAAEVAVCDAIRAAIDFEQLLSRAEATAGTT